LVGKGLPRCAPRRDPPARLRGRLLHARSLPRVCVGRVATYPGSRACCARKLVTRDSWPPHVAWPCVRPRRFCALAPRARLSQLRAPCRPDSVRGEGGNRERGREAEGNNARNELFRARAWGAVAALCRMMWPGAWPWCEQCCRALPRARRPLDSAASATGVLRLSARDLACASVLSNVQGLPVPWALVRRYVPSRSHSRSLKAFAP